MIPNLMLVFGVVALAMALRSFGHPLLFRLGSLCVVVATFLAGWLLGGSAALGVVMAAAWFVLPWIEIVTRLRKLRIPGERVLEQRSPPSRADFPGLEEFSSQIEREGFEHAGDVGWEDPASRQFYRLFLDGQSRTHAAICLAEQGELSFYYLSVTSRLPSGKIFLTWNYPFSYGLKFSPAVAVNRLEGPLDFHALLESHRRFLRSRGIADAAAAVLDLPALMDAMQRDFRAQIRHNLDLGLLRRDDQSVIRYTLRGMFFLWFQFLRDLVKIF